MTIVNERPLGRVGRVALAGGPDRRDHPRRHRSDQPVVLPRVRLVGALLVVRRTVERDRLASPVDRVRLHRHDRSPWHERRGAAGRHGARSCESLFAWTSSWAGYASYLAFVGLARPLPVRPSAGRPMAVADRGLPDHRGHPRRRDRGGALVHVQRRRWRDQPRDPPIRWRSCPRCPLGRCCLPMARWPWCSYRPLVVAVVAMVVRYRRSTGIVRLQLRWLVSSMVFCSSPSDSAWFHSPSSVTPWAVWSGSRPSSPSRRCPWRSGSRSFATACTRSTGSSAGRSARRWSRGCSRSSSLLVLGLTPRSGRPMTGGNTIAVAASTLVVVALFQPVAATGQDESSIDASTGLATTASERWPPSPPTARPGRPRGPSGRP